jgi:uncharacterized RDD family membrane protein YckC
MTQPPDDRVPPPRDPDAEVPADEPVAPDSAPTVAWSPSDATPSDSEPPSETAAETPPAEAPPVPSPGPIISADTTTQPAPGWEVPGAPPPLPASVSGGGWEIPSGVAPVQQQEGYVVAGLGARFVAWLIDIVLSSIVPIALAAILVDWNSLLQSFLDQIRFDASGRPISTGMITFPVTLDLILITLISVGVQFLYFIGFWTSRWQATPGMIGLRMRLVDANTGGELSLMQASKRWVAMGWPLALLVIVPVLQNAISLAQFGLNFFLFISAFTNVRRQGWHDKVANSLVIRSVTSGDGATFIGCLVYIVMVILLSVVAALALTAIAGPTFFEWVRELPRYQQ